MSVGALVTRVGEVLSRGHALFGESSASAPPDPGLATAAVLVRAGHQRISTLSGALPTGYTTFAGGAGPALDAAAGTDQGVIDAAVRAARTDRAGRTASGRAVEGAATDTAALSPSTGTAAGQRALIGALRARVSEQQRVISAYRVRDARLAILLRSLSYPRSGIGPSMPGGLPGGGLGGGAGPSLSRLPGLAGLSGLGGRPSNRGTVLASGVDWLRRGGQPPAGPGEGAVQAALSKLGRPYVWGAKGPGAFDCSGLTQWAWNQAGVKLGGDTYTQITDGVRVAAGQVRAGDLIFPLDSFGEGGRPGPGHVQLAISADEVVHAPHTGDVVRVAPMPTRYVAVRPTRSVQV